MIDHAFLDDELRDQAALYVLGSMPEDDARQYRLHLAACDACRAEVDLVSEVTGELALLAPAEPPPAELFERTLERVRAAEAPCAAPLETDEPAVGQVWKRWRDDSAGAAPITYLDRGATGFEPTAFPGVRARQLFVDREHQRVTMLVRMDPGAAYPPHRHAGPEDCFVLEGDLDTGDHRMHAGDFSRAAEGSVHAVQSTRAGCLLLIVSALGDELIA